MLSLLFEVPSSTEIINGASSVAGAWIPQFMEVVYFSVGVVVFIGVIMFLIRIFTWLADSLFGGTKMGVSSEERYSHDDSSFYRAMADYHAGRRRYPPIG